MSRLDTQFAACGLPALMAQLGRAAVYTPRGGDAVELTAMIGAEVTAIEEGERGTERVRRREVKITRDPAGPYGGVADPQLGDTMTIDGQVWEIEDDDPGIVAGGPIAVLPLVRYERTEVGRYRMDQQ